MLYLLALGRDMDTTGTKTGPQVELILTKALAVSRQYLDDVTIVVAPGFSPDLPGQVRPYAALMADWLRERGCQHVIELCADTFDTDGEVRAFHAFCRGHLRPGDAIGICGFSWHLPRVKLIAWRIDRRWSRSLLAFPVEFPMPVFDRHNEWKKYLKALLPKRWQVSIVQAYKRFINSRTSY